MIDVFKNPELNYNSNLLGRSSSSIVNCRAWIHEAAAGAGDLALRYAPRRYARVTTKAVAALQFNRTIY